MRTRAILVTVLMAAGLAVSQANYCCAKAMSRSAHAFSEYFHALQQEPLNPVERVVVSLVLANAKAHQHPQPAVHL